MRVMLTGARGQLGSDVYKELLKSGILENEIYAPTHEELDIIDSKKVLNNVLAFDPDVIIHCAAYVKVDDAEKNKEECLATNFIGTKNLATVAKYLGAKFVYISTDYVFDGSKKGEYEVDDETCPINYYGYTKLQGENIVKDLDKSFIFRISWVFGENGKNFIKTMLRLSETKNEITVVGDQIGSPTYTLDAAKTIVEAISTSNYGVYHLTNEGFMSWADIAKKTFEVAGKDVKVIPIKTIEYKTLAARPLNSKLSKASLDAAGFKRLPDAEDAIKRYVKQIIR